MTKQTYGKSSAQQGSPHPEQFEVGLTPLQRGLRLKAPVPKTLARLLRSPSAVVGAAIATVLIVLHVGAPLFTDIAPLQTNPREALEPPSREHPFGTDQLGRDLFSRVLYGGRISITIAVAVVGATTITGLIAGTLAGFYPRLDIPISRIMDVLASFPALLLALAIAAILRPSLTNIVIALVIPSTPGLARVIRGVVLSVRQQDFITAARCVGARDGRIIMRHVIPNCMAPLLVNQTLLFGSAILAEAGLSFLGVGLPPGTPTLGGTVSLGRTYIRTLPWMSLPAGVFISLLVISFNLLGDGLRDALDPRMKY